MSDEVPTDGLPIKDVANATQAIATFGTTVVTEAANLARYVGRVLGTAPKDAVGLILGDPLHFVRGYIAAQYDRKITEILDRRQVKDPQPVSPSIAIPLLRAAYDESRPELQELWAALIAAAMDPKRNNRVRLSFIEALRKFDPLDAVLLKSKVDTQGITFESEVDALVMRLKITRDEVFVSARNLISLGCLNQTGQANTYILTPFGRELYRACQD